MITKELRDMIESEAKRYSSSFCDRAYASEKNEYDDEVKLSKCDKPQIKQRRYIM